MSIMKLKPAFKDYLWGGVKLRTDFGKDCDFEKIAESWELSCHKNGMSVIDSGGNKGKTLAEFLTENPGAAGTNGEAFEDFPILIKLIDAKDNLSIQVHPDDSYALKNEGQYGKTEMWYIVDCEPGAFLYYGFNIEIDKETFKAKIADNTILDVLNKVFVKPGDVFFISPGTLHAIGAGILIAEIQQNSDVTYRVYDFGRKGPDGKERELHVDKAVNVTNLCRPDEVKEVKERRNDGYTGSRLASCKYFTVDKLEVDGKAALNCDKTSFVSLLCLDGNADVCCGGDKISVKKGDSLFIPAGSGEYTIDGKAAVILSRV